MEQILQGMSEKEQQEVLRIMKEIADKGESERWNKILYADYKEIPVDILTFVRDTRYLGKAWHTAEGKYKLFPFWEKKLQKLFPTNLTTNYNTAILTGARGLGKSEIAILCALYVMYRVMCLRDPLSYFNLKPTDTIAFAFMNITKDLVEEIGNNKFQNTVQCSPWFMQRGTMSGIKNKVWNPPSYINIILGSQSSDVIGQAVLFGFFDEISFIKNQDVERQKDIARNMISTAVGGMKTRYLYQGKNPTLLVLASSKRSEVSFLESYVKKLAETDNQKSLVVDDAIWNVKPEGTYTQGWFKVAIGNKFLASEIVSRDLEFYINKGYKIIDVPKEHLDDFLEDVDRALCDFAGISSSDLMKYISGAKVQEAADKSFPNVFSKEEIEVGMNDGNQYWQFIDSLERIPEDLKYKPMFIHMDLSVSGDCTGIAGVIITGKKPGEGDKDLYFKVVFAVAIKAPKGHAISFKKNRQFIYWLKEKGFNIIGVSTDSYQSSETGQELTTNGYKYKKISVDEVKDYICQPYAFFKNCIYDKRIELLNHKILLDEISDLERNSVGKIDHPFGGRKDISDAVCGALWNASQHSEEFSYEYGESLELLLETNLHKSGEILTTKDFTEQIRQTEAQKIQRQLDVARQGRVQKMVALPNKTTITPNEENSQTIFELMQPKNPVVYNQPPHVRTTLETSWSRDEIDGSKDSLWFGDGDIVVI